MSERNSREMRIREAIGPRDDDDRLANDLWNRGYRAEALLAMPKLAQKEGGAGEMTGVELIAEERARQKAEEGYDARHDAEHVHGELAIAAVCYAAPGAVRMQVRALFSDGTALGRRWVDPWPFGPNEDKRKKHDRIHQLVIAGALLAAEIDRQLAARPARKVRS